MELLRKGEYVRVENENDFDAVLKLHYDSGFKTIIGDQVIYETIRDVKDVYNKFPLYISRPEFEIYIDYEDIKNSEEYKKLKERPLSDFLQKSYDYINPNHYTSGTKEVWEMMVDIWGKEAFINHCEMTAFKYRMRAGLKPDQPIERDLEKAKWYEEKIKQLKS